MGQRGAVRIGRVLGVPVVLQRSWFLFAALVVLLYGNALDDRGDNGYVAALVFVVLLLVSVLLHEVGHCVVARAFGLPVSSISVSFLAGITQIDEAPQTPAREYSVAVSGPMVSLLLGAVAAAGALLAPDDSTAELVLQLIAAANIVVAAFNLLPGLPLDGGRVLRAIVWRLTRDPYRATVVSARAGQGVGLVVVPGLVLGAIPLTGGDVSLMTAAFAGLISSFIYLGATSALTSARIERVLPGVRAGGLARHALTVTADLPLAEALRRAGEHDLHAIVVVDAEGRARGLVSEARVLAVPAERRPWVAVSTVARTLDEALVLDAGLAGQALVEAMARTPASEYLVTDPAGGAPRVLAAADVAKALAT